MKTTSSASSSRGSKDHGSAEIESRIDPALLIMSATSITSEIITLTSSDSILTTSSKSSQDCDPVSALSQQLDDQPACKTKDCDKESLTNIMSKCPICGHSVSMMSKRQKKPMKVHQQMTFCKAHQTKDAQTQWTRCDYSRISWRTLGVRIRKHFDQIRDILNEDSPSFYRSALKTIVDKNERRKFGCMNNATIEYYEPRGERVLTKHIITEFEPELHRKAVTDRLLRITGVAEYVLIVLVPELTMILIMKELKVSAKIARDILNASAHLGEMLQEDT